MMKNNVTGLLTILVCLSGISTISYAENHAVGIGLNNAGPGIFYTYTFSENLHVRTSLNGISVNKVDLETSDIDYQGDVDSSALGIMVDWYPASQGWQRNIFISGGLFYDSFEYKGDAELKNAIRVGDTKVTTDDINGLNVDIERKGLSPYIGAGWGNKTRKDRGFAFVSELGLILNTTADVVLTANDPNSSLTTSDLTKERNDIQEDNGGLAAFLSVGVGYHF